MTAGKVRVFKFGGASVKSAEGVVNLAKIIRNEQQPLIIVVSAMGKTTNALEGILAKYMAGDNQYKVDFANLKAQHIAIAKGLLEDDGGRETRAIEDVFDLLEGMLDRPPQANYNYSYDQIVSFGEIFSTMIVSSYLNKAGIANTWVDCREVLRTDNNYREGNVNYEVSQALCKKTFTFGDGSSDIYVTQGFIGGTEQGHTTTLGREGSDYTAALLANLLDADSVTIWKDVDGVLNADPRIFSNTIKLNEVSFKEAIELAYCGAQIIHPKTIKPLQNKQIPLYVKSFINSQGSGTKVYQTDISIQYPPILIQKLNQVLISLTPRDFSFVIEDCLSKIFATLYKHRVKANLVQSSAISFSICVDDEEHFLPGAIEELSLDFKVRYNKGLELLTVRHYNDDAIAKNTQGKEPLLMQKTRSTFRAVLRVLD